MKFSPKYLIPQKQRQHLRVAMGLLWHNPLRLWRLLRIVQLRSVGDVLSCFEYFEDQPAGRLIVWLRGISSSVHLRFGTSDFAVFRQVFLDKQYDLRSVHDARYIIDAGANIGLASVYFLAEYPRARVIAIEPDSENFEIAQENLRPFGDRCQLIRGAVWSQPGELEVSRGSFRDGRHWSTQTIAVTQGSVDTVRAYTITELLEEADFPQIDLLKVDIEGAELQVFRDGETQFLSKTRCCAVECHGDECIEAFVTETRPLGFQISQQGELHIASMV